MNATISADTIELAQIVLPRKSTPPKPTPKPPTQKEKLEALIKEIRDIAKSLLEKLKSAKEILEDVAGPCKLKAVAAATFAASLIAAMVAFIGAIPFDATGIGEVVQALAVFVGIGAIVGLLVMLDEVTACLVTQLAAAKEEGNAKEVERVQKQIDGLKDVISGIRNDATRLGKLVDLAKNLLK